MLAIPIEEVSNEAQYVSQRLRSFAPSPRALELIASSEHDRDRIVAQLRPRLARTRAVIASRATVDVLRGLRSELEALEGMLVGGEALLDDQARELADALRDLDRMRASWIATRQVAHSTTTPDPIRRRVSVTLEAIEGALKQLRTRRDAALSLLDRFVEEREEVDNALADIDSEIEARLGQLLGADRAPIWQSEAWAALLESLRDPPVGVDIEGLEAYLGDHIQVLATELLVVVVIGFLLRILGGRLRARRSRYPEISEVESIWKLPFSMAFLLVIVVAELSYSLHPLAPPLYSVFVVSLFAVVPVVRIGRRCLPDSMRGAVYGLTALFIADRIHYLLTPAEELARWYHVFELAGAMALAVWLRRIGSGEGHDRRVALARVCTRVAIGLFGVALLAEIAGWSQLAVVVGVGTQRAAFRILVVYAIFKASEALVVYALTSRVLERLNAVRQHRLLVRDRLLSIMKWLAFALWGYMALDAYGLRVIAYVGLKAALASGITVGTLSLSLGDLVAFGLTLTAAFWAARIVEFTLGEEVYPRLRLPRGMPYALSALARYSLLLVGFLFALAAAGIELGRLAILAGGLGVGIGFGLQNVTNNFISGLILLFERPVQVGDMVELQPLTGRIRRIGIRATVIETLDGAEVIVPNGHLISDLVTNWTLSYPHRRIELKVGVAYGTDAEQVMGLLLEAARSCEDVREEPAPQAFFVGFGDSALEFVVRVWTSRYELEVPVRSQVAVAVQRALADAGISVPFPQRDLHLKTVSDALRPGLGREAGEDPS